MRSGDYSRWSRLGDFELLKSGYAILKKMCSLVNFFDELALSFWDTVTSGAIYDCKQVVYLKVSVLICRIEILGCNFCKKNTSIIGII